VKPEDPGILGLQKTHSPSFSLDSYVLGFLALWVKMGYPSAALPQPQWSVATLNAIQK